MCGSRSLSCITNIHSTHHPKCPTVKSYTNHIYFPLFSYIFLLLTITFCHQKSSFSIFGPMAPVRPRPERLSLSNVIPHPKGSCLTTNFIGVAFVSFKTTKISEQWTATSFCWHSIWAKDPIDSKKPEFREDFFGGFPLLNDNLSKIQCEFCLEWQTCYTNQNTWDES